ncbi:MAG: pyruvate ferredoxin oxidoreductase [Candidatus Cloacimonadota bacterium]|nr:MAG: pyruvate ferredoxin oxidoreductase [Candidatus Cloacimonadota bacterium]
MKQVIMGNHALSYGAMISRVQVIAAYPITPQTQVVELLSEICADKRLDAEFIKVESEHSALAACCGASAVGARTFTATSAQGLALMHEMIHWAVGGRLPVVIGNINRAMGPPWTIWTDQNDSLSQRDTGCLQFYAQSNQEVLDTVVQAFKVSEQVLLPSMIVLDAFCLSHTSEVVDVPDQKLVDEYLPPFNPRYRLDPEEPHTFGGLTGPDGYYELRYKIEEAIQDAKRLIKETGKEFGEMFGRQYGLIEKYKMDDADLVLVASSTVASTAHVAIDELRNEGKKVGLLRVRVFRPFPTEEIRELLCNRRKVAVIDRNISFGHSGIFAQEIKSALYNCKNASPIWGYITGLGGRDVTVEDIKEIVNDTIKSDKPEKDILWKGVKL